MEQTNNLMLEPGLSSNLSQKKSWLEESVDELTRTLGSSVVKEYFLAQTKEKMDLDLQSLNTAQEVSGGDKNKEFQKHLDEDSAVEDNFGDGEDSESSEESESIKDFDSIEGSKSIDNSESIEDSESSKENERKIIKEDEKQCYREPKTNLSDDENTSSFDVDSSSDSDPGAFLDTIHKGTVTNKLVNDKMKTKGEIDLDDLPPVEDLYISVQTNDLVKIGVVWAIHDRLVSILSSEDTPTLNFESVLFIAPDKPLGKVYDIFGPVRKPFYAVRFNCIEDITEKCVTENADIFYAPGRSDLVCYVPVDELRKQKGSDASWKDNNEPPEEYLDYSDDEQERAAKQKRRAKSRRETLPDDGISFVPPKIADRRQDALKCSMSHAGNGSTNSENSYAEFHPQQTFRFRAPQTFVPMQRQNLFQPPQPTASAFYSQPRSQPPASIFHSQPRSQPPASTFHSQPSPQPPISTFYSQPSPQPPVSTFYSPQPSPQPPVSTFYSPQPSPQPPVSTFYSQPSPQPSVSTFYSQPSPQPPVSTFYLQPPRNFNPDQSSRVPIPPRQTFVARAMPVTHQQPVFGHLPFRGALRPTMSPPVPSIRYATPQLMNCPTPSIVIPSPTLPVVIPSPTPPVFIPCPTPPIFIPCPTPPVAIPCPTPPVAIPCPTPPVAIPCPSQHLIHFPPPATLGPRLPGGYHGFNGPRTINPNWPQGQSFSTVPSNSAVMQAFRFRSPVPVDVRNPTSYTYPVNIYVPPATSVSATPPPQNYFHPS